MGKDIFISYRREGGEHLALLIYHQLRYDGYSVFLDVESLRKGKFDEALFERIREATDFILILPPKALDRCANSDDWVRQEIEFALREKKNIIPIMMEGFDSWPADLPETMMAVSKFNGLKNHQGYFGDMMRKLEKGFLESSPRMQSGPAESAEEDIEILEKCQHCGSDNIVCEDPFPNHLYWLRILRRAIHWWVCLTPFAFFLIMLLGSASTGESQSLQVLGLRLDFLLQNPVVQSIDFGPLSPLHFAATMAALLLIGNKAYQYSETPAILAKETTSRSVTVTCKRCAAKRRIQVSTELLPESRSKKGANNAGFMFFVMITGILISCYSMLASMGYIEDARDNYAPITLLLVILTLSVGYLVGHINAYMNALPEKTFRNYLREDFSMYEQSYVEETQENEDEFNRDFQEMPELKVLKYKKKK